MKLSNLGANKTAISFENGNVVFFSYNTPVAALMNGEYVRTSKKWSVTTSKHIGQWLDGIKAREVDQAVLDQYTGMVQS